MIQCLFKQNWDVQNLGYRNTVKLCRPIYKQLDNIKSNKCRDQMTYNMTNTMTSLQQTGRD